MGSAPVGNPTSPAGSRADALEGRSLFSREWSVEILRIGLGVIWALNLVFIVDPSNGYFSTFASTAQGYGPSSVAGPGFANFVAQHDIVFAWIIAGTTVYLSVALILGLTTRLACYIGTLFSAAFLWTQFGSTFVIPGGTDVGAHPLYLLIYFVLIAGGAGRRASVDQWIWGIGHLRHPRLSRWLAAPEREFGSGSGRPGSQTRATGSTVPAPKE